MAEKRLFGGAIVETDPDGGHRPQVVLSTNDGAAPTFSAPADPFGANADAAVAAGATGSMQAKLRRLTTDLGSLVTSFATLLSGGIKDAGPAWTPARVNVSSADQSGAAADLSAAPTSGQKRILDDIVASADAAMRVDVKEETSGTVLLSFYLPANGTVQITPRSGLKFPTADKKIQVQTSAAGNVRILALTHSEA